jgi:signal peptidase II
MSLSVFALAALACVGCDQLTKELARLHLGDGAAGHLAGGAIRFALVENPGAFMSLGAGYPEALRTALLGVAVPLALVLLAVAFLRRARRSAGELIGLALLVGGGAGNWLDRLRAGAVTDFVSIGVGPLRTGVFNAADVAIFAGAALLLLSAWDAAGAGAEAGADR